MANDPNNTYQVAGGAIISAPGTTASTTSSGGAGGTNIPASIANAIAQGLSYYRVNGRTYYLQSNGDWKNEAGEVVTKAEIAPYQTQQAASSSSSQGAQSAQQQAATIQTQLADLQAQQVALTKYGLADTNQLQKDASGNYIPKTSTTQTTGTQATQGQTSQANQQVTDIQNQLADLQAQQSAMSAFGLTDTNQLTKDASGNYVPNSTSLTNILTTAGLSAATIAAMTPAQQLTMASVSGLIQKQYQQSNPVPSAFTADDLNRLMTEAQNDPVISKYYNDQVRQGQTEFMNAFNLYSASANTQAAEQARQYQNSQKDLENAKGKAGLAYSGFKKQAEEDLSQQESNIVESSQQQIKSNLQQLGSSFEKKYGTDALPQLGTIQGQSYTPVGNVTGTNAASQTADVTSAYNELVKKEALIKGVTI